MAKLNGNGERVKSMESWIWGAACSIRGAADAAKFKEYILPSIFIKLCNVFHGLLRRQRKPLQGIYSMISLWFYFINRMGYSL